MNKENCTSKDELMNEIMKYDFAAYELVLFLDTNPCDLKALEMHEAIINKAKCLKKKYIEHYGPITNKDASTGETWSWINSPWPWEN